MIEKNVQNGELVQYVVGRESSGKKQDDASQQPPQDQQTEQNPPRPQNVVDVISGGSVGRVIGKKRRDLVDAVLAVSEHPAKRDRAYLGTVLSFLDEDYPVESVEPHEGALVITAQVGPIDMRRMMIGNGSSVDILYSHA